MILSDSDAGAGVAAKPDTINVSDRAGGQMTA